MFSSLQQFQTNSDESSTEYDVVVVGAGMVGASAAIGLSMQGRRVLVLDAFPFDRELPEYTPSYDMRSTALSWGTRDILDQLNLWSEIEQHSCAMTCVHVSEQGRFGTTRINTEEFNQDALGYVVPNQWMGRCLLQRVYESNIDFVSGTIVESVETLSCGSHELYIKSVVDSGAAERDFKEKRVKLKTKLLVIADGAQSKTAQAIGIEYQVREYQQHALVANVTTSADNMGVAFERFTQKGPLAMLPLTKNTCSLVWTHPNENIDEYLSMSENDFCRRLEQVFGERLGLIEKCGKRSSYPLKLVQAKEQCRAGILLLGNAAHSLHPVAGQGFNLAIRGVAAFLEYMQGCDQQALDYGSLSGLRKLCESREMDQMKTVLMSDQLIKIFSSDLFMVKQGRDAALLGMDLLKPLKSAFSAQAMGIAGRKAKFINSVQ